MVLQWKIRKKRKSVQFSDDIFKCSTFYMFDIFFRHFLLRHFFSTFLQQIMISDNDFDIFDFFDYIHKQRKQNKFFQSTHHNIFLLHLQGETFLKYLVSLAELSCFYDPTCQMFERRRKEYPAFRLPDGIGCCTETVSTGPYFSQNYY